MTAVTIESLDREGRGVAHVEGKALFVEGALPGEYVSCSIYRDKRSFSLAQAQSVHKASPSRVEPACRYYGVCGGCSMQHMDMGAQVAAKQRVLEDCLWHISRLRAEVMLSPIYGPGWRYRRRARLSVRHVEKKGGVLIGFHERHSSFVADMLSCEVLPETLSARIPELRRLIDELSIRERIPQIEFAGGESLIALVLRVLDPPSAKDKARLRDFAAECGFQLWLQPGGPDSARPLWPLDPAPLDYSLPEFDVRIRFAPTDFIQVNFAVNRMLVRRALRLLEPGPGDQVADFFCGLGNFSLPIARCGASVHGVDADMQLVKRAAENARLNGLQRLCRFKTGNLFEARACAGYERFDKLIIDPPREGAIELVKSLQGPAPARIVYVSCDPATLARDAAVLVHKQGFRLAAACVANMFPHTSHIESLALFERG